jgi:hypothetical protein
MAIEFNQRGIPFSQEHPIPIHYKGSRLGSPYRADFLCYQSVIVELKALSGLTVFEEAQVIHYLKATGIHSAPSSSTLEHPDSASICVQTAEAIRLFHPDLTHEN